MTSAALAGTSATSVGGGTLSWSFTTINSNCVDGAHNPVPFTQTNFNTFSFVDSHGTTFPFGQAAVYIQSPGGINCPPNGFQPAGGLKLSFTSAGANQVITWLGNLNGTGSASIVTNGYSGYLNPKYVIVGLTYSPPGPSSFVDYSNTMTVSTTDSIGGTFTSTYMSSLTTAATAGLLGWKAGASTTISAGYSQVSTSSNSLELDETVARSYRTGGAANPYTGIDHDYDIVWLWLNPVELFTTNTNSSGSVTNVVWNGYGVSTLDQPVADIYPVYVGWLNGDIPMTTSQAMPLKRLWAASEVWPSGQVPGVTGPGAGTDFDQIKKVDPYWSCTKTPATCPTTVDLTRYTLTPNNPDFLYLQAPVGGTPLTQTYMETYTTLSTMARGGSFTTTQGFAFETTLSGSIFAAKIELTLLNSSMFSEMHTWDHKLAATNTSTGLLSITGPPCVVVGNTCNPLYNKSTQFDLYEDSLFATFFLNAVN